MASQVLLGPIVKKVAAEFNRMQLEKLDPEWLKEAVDREFMQYDSLPLEFEEILDECHIIVRMTTAQKHCATWLETCQAISSESRRVSTATETSQVGAAVETSEMTDNDEANSSSKYGALFWKYLIEEENFNPRSLLSLVGFFIEKGALLTSEADQRDKCFAAANLYLTLISIPGSMAFNVFHQMLYLKALQLIQLYITASKNKRKQPVSRKGGRQQVTEAEDEEDGTTHVSAAVAVAIESLTSKYLDKLALVSQHLSFRRYPNILKETIEIMLPLISLGQGPISLKALGIIQQFCNPLHGDAIQTVHYIFVHLLPYLALDPSKKDLNNQELLALRDISFDLVSNFVQKFGEPIYPMFQRLIKHLCLEVVDRAEYRQKTAQTVLDLLRLVPENIQEEIVHWFLELAYSEQAYLRLFALELMARLLHQDPIHPLILPVLCSHCSDPSATVRAKALSVLGDCIESKNTSLVTIFDTIFSAEQRPQREVEPVGILEVLQGEIQVDDPTSLLPTAQSILELLEERATDDKVYVRKNALHLLLTLMRRDGDARFLTKDLLKLLANSCRDVALLVRRHMAQMMTELVLQYPEHVAVQRVWVRSVLPLILDGENRVQEKVLECLEQLILKSLASSDDTSNTLGWSLLAIITDLGLGTYLSKAAELWARQNLIQPQMLRTLQNNTVEHSRAAWTFMAIISRHVTIDSHTKKFVMEYLLDHVGSTNPANVYCMQQVLKTLATTLPTMKHDHLTTIRTHLSRPISSYHLPTDLIADAVDLVVYCIQGLIADEEAARKETIQWASDVLESCGEYLRVHFKRPDCVSMEEEEQLARRIITVGCAAIHTPWTVTKKHFLILQHATFQPESGVDAPIPFSQSQPTRKLPPKLQAAAIISLGKLCIQNEEMAKQLIPGLGKLLETTPHEAVRNNIICILCDWVVRYGTSVDPVMSQVTACLRDPSISVRKQTLVLLIHLLQEDYLKIRGTFFFRILQLACDDDEELRDLALFYVTQRLLVRQPNIVQQHFIECVFHFNDYKGHSTFNKFILTDRERNLFSIAGTANAKRRMEIYVFMLQNMDDESRFQLTFRLSRDILLGVVEGTLPLKNSCTEVVLKDALAILASDDIKLASLKATTEEDPIEKEDLAQAILQSTKKAIIAQVVKRNVIENIVPIVVQLKRKLASLKSSLMGDLMIFLRELMKDYKDEITEVLSADRQLMAEIDFDLKRFEQQQKQDAAANKERTRLSERSLISKTPSADGRQLQPSNRRSIRKEIATEGTEEEAEDAQEEPVQAEVQLPSQDVLQDPNAEDMEVDAPVPEPIVQDTEHNPTGTEPIAPFVEPTSTIAEPVKTIPSDSQATAAVPQVQPANPVEPVTEDLVQTTDKRHFEVPQHKAKSRLLKPRIMSTPIRETTVTDVTFQIDQEADLSAIPYPEERPKTKRRLN